MYLACLSDVFRNGNSSLKLTRGPMNTHIGALESRSSTQSVTYYFSKRLFHDLLEHKNSQFKVLKFFQPKIISSGLIVV